MQFRVGAVAGHYLRGEKLESGFYFRFVAVSVRFEGSVFLIGMYLRADMLNLVKLSFRMIPIAGAAPVSAHSEP